MKLFTTTLALLFALAVSAQSTNEAKKLLNEVSQKTKGYKTQTISFINEIDAPTGNDKQPRSSRKTRGTALVKGNKYRIDMGSFLVIHDGKKTYMVYPDDQEINVMDSKEQNANLTPSGILDAYDKGYSYSMGGKETIKGKTIQYIRLKPKANSEVKEIMLGVDMSTKQLYNYKQFAQDGVITTLTVETYQVNTAISEEVFNLKAKEFQGFEMFKE
jgi:outer membrane lipoprotein-sorting protein